MRLPAEFDSEQESLRRVVVVEDNAITLRLIATWLTGAGYEVYTAMNGEQALQAIDACQPSIVVTDWNMPGMSGLELCRAIRNNDHRPYIYTLIVTSREDRKDVIQAIDAGADDFLPKPIKEEELLARVGQAKAALCRFRQYVERAETDALTGALNRRRFSENCVREIARASRDGAPLSCALLDIDLFKQINDSFGHAVGDLTLRAVADVLRENTRVQDSICRYGGDEFCLLLPGMAETAAIAFAERIRGALAVRPLSAGERQVPVRVTIGVAEWRQNVLTPRQLIDLADEALLAAKRSGRDCVVGYGSFHNLQYLNRSVGSELHARFAQVTAGDIMASPVVTLSEQLPLTRAADLFLRLRINSVPVVNGDSRLVGIISEQDVLNSVTVDADWDRPIRDVMKPNVVAYDATTPATAIWDFLRRVTVRRVVVVEDEIPVGVVSRGTLLRWMGNWGSLLHQRPRHDEVASLNLLCSHIRSAASGIAREAERLQRDVAKDEGAALSKAVNAATRLQEQAQDLLALCQIHYQFNPRPDGGPAAAPLARLEVPGAAAAIPAGV